MPALDGLALLDIEGSESFVLSEEHPGLLPPDRMTYGDVVRACDDLRYFAVKVAGDRPMRWARVLEAHTSWVAGHGLLTGSALSRFLEIVQIAQDDVEVDLSRLGLDFGALWRKRRWRYLLNQIDHLPRTTWTQQRLANDERYAARVAASIEQNPPAAAGTGPALMEWSPEVAMGANVVDAVRRLTTVLIAVNSKEGAPAPKFEPFPRPQTLVARMSEKAERKARWSAHERLADRLLPHRRTQQEARS